MLRVMAGGCGGYFRTGRYLRYSDAPHSQLLVSLSNAMGRATDSVGNADYGHGQLPGLR